MDIFLSLTPQTVDGIDSILRGFVTTFNTPLSVAVPVNLDDAMQTYVPIKYVKDQMINKNSFKIEHIVYLGVKH